MNLGKIESVPFNSLKAYFMLPFCLCSWFPVMRFGLILYGRTVMNLDFKMDLKITLSAVHFSYSMQVAKPWHLFRPSFLQLCCVSLKQHLLSEGFPCPLWESEGSQTSLL